MSQKLESPIVLRERSLKGELLTAKEMRKLEKWKWSVPGLIASSREHVGKILDNVNGTNIKDATDAIIYAILAYQSFNVFGKYPTSALIGPIGLKLAMTSSGGIPVSQVAGLSILAALGIVSTPQVQSAMNYGLIAQANAVQGQPPPAPPPGYRGIPTIYDVIYDITQIEAYINSLLNPKK